MILKVRLCCERQPFSKFLWLSLSTSKANPRGRGPPCSWRAQRTLFQRGAGRMGECCPREGNSPVPGPKGGNGMGSGVCSSQRAKEGRGSKQRTAPRPPQLQTPAECVGPRCELTLADLASRPASDHRVLCHEVTQSFSHTHGCCHLSKGGGQGGHSEREHFKSNMCS